MKKLNLKENWSSVICMLVGIMCICVGIFILYNYTGTRGTVLREYGADFYTDIYSLTRSIVSATGDAKEVLRLALGHGMIFVGITEIAFFGGKLKSYKKGNTRSTNGDIENPQDTTCIDDMSI